MEIGDDEEEDEVVWEAARRHGWGGARNNEGRVSSSIRFQVGFSSEQIPLMDLEKKID